MTDYCPRCRGHHHKAKRNYEDKVTAQIDADNMTGELKPDWPFEVYRCPLGNIHVGVPQPRFRIGPKLPANWSHQRSHPNETKETNNDA